MEESVNRPAMSGGKFPWTNPLLFMGRKVGWALYSGDVVPDVDYMFGELYEDEKKIRRSATGLWASLTIYTVIQGDWGGRG